MADDNELIGEDIVIDDTEILDEDETSNEEEPLVSERFDISSYGWDVDVEGLVKRMNRGDIYVPGFQRGFVWSGSEKSRFIESLILGLPVPTLFLARDSEIDNRLNIIDGQQRLKTLQSYLNGEFSLSGKDIPDDLKGRYYSSRRSAFGERKAYPKAKTLDQADERTLTDAVVHSIVIRPNPKDDDTDLGREYNKAIIQIFKRLNTTGKALNAQEVRASIFHGSLLSLIQELNEDAEWRSLFGKTHSRMKDQEAILRVIALSINGKNYKAPMPRFLDDFMDENRNISNEDADKLRTYFKLSLEFIRASLGDDALKRGGTFMLTRFDALATGIMGALHAQQAKATPEFRAEFLQKLGDRSVADRLSALEADDRGLDDAGEEIADMETHERGYNWSVAKFTNDTNRVEARLLAAKNAFTVE
jgi:hypothetical protein